MQGVVINITLVPGTGKKCGSLGSWQCPLRVIRGKISWEDKRVEIEGVIFDCGPHWARSSE